MEDKGDILKAICDEVINDPDLQPHGGRTFCNKGAERISHVMGCFDFDGLELDADQMYTLISCSLNWTKCTGQEATIHALSGGLAFAIMTSIELGELHGHIAAIYPVGMQWSGSLSKDVPLVANCGKQNGEEKVSQAFPPSRGEPNYFCWTQS